MTNKITVKSLNARATRLTASRSKNNTAMQSLFIDMLKHAEANNNNFDPFIHVLNRLSKADALMVKNWLVQVSPAKVTLDKETNKFSVKLDKHDDITPAARYSIRLAEKILWYVKQDGDKIQKAEKTFDEIIEMFAKKLAKSEIYTLEKRKELHDKLDAYLNAALEQSKSKKAA